MDIKKEVEELKNSRATPADRLGNLRISSYIRVSSKAIGQDQRRQIQGYKDFVTGSELLHQSSYMEVSSARGGVIRKVFNNMMADAKAHKFDILWCEQPSRLGRNVREGLNHVHELHELGIKVYFSKFNSVFDLSNHLDKTQFLLYMMMAETESDWNSVNTTKSMGAKARLLQKWARDNNLLDCKSGGGKKFSTMILADPHASGSKDKKGVCTVEVPHMEDMFVQYHMAGYTYEGLGDLFRQPVSPKCHHECWNGTEMPFNSMPRAKGVRGEYDRLTRAEVAKFLASGGWSNYIKSDAEIRRTHPQAFETKTGKPREKRTCSCGQKMSKATVSTHIKRLCYDTGIEEKRHPHAFVRAEADSTELSLEDLDKVLASGSVSSR
jgi:DNA invertase Pin-like site-specific DNA recombinase